MHFAPKPGMLVKILKQGFFNEGDIAKVEEHGDYLTLTVTYSKNLRKSSPLKNFNFGDLKHLTQSEINAYTNKTQTIMERKLIGYKLKEECKQYENAAVALSPGSLDFRILSLGVAFTPKSYAAKKLQEAGVLDLWFSPVYEEIPQFKAGDWVVFDVKKAKKVGLSTETWNKNHILKVSSVFPAINQNLQNLDFKGFENPHSTLCNHSSFGNRSDMFRFATKEEVEEATKPKEFTLLYKGLPIKFNGDKIVFPRCSEDYVFTENELNYVFNNRYVLYKEGKLK